MEFKIDIDLDKVMKDALNDKDFVAGLEEKLGKEMQDIVRYTISETLFPWSRSDNYDESFGGKVRALIREKLEVFKEKDGIWMHQIESIDYDKLITAKVNKEIDWWLSHELELIDNCEDLDDLLREQAFGSDYDDSSEDEYHINWSVDDEPRKTQVTVELSGEDFVFKYKDDRWYSNLGTRMSDTLYIISNEEFVEFVEKYDDVTRYNPHFDC